jgi:redox-sensitive bicupin YhaK (pirin superfamily)
MSAPATSVDIRRADTRFHTDFGWLDSRHSFSFGGHYDPDNVGHGLLLVVNDDIVSPGRGFGAHSHRDMEIVSWVLDGELEHRDSEGNHGVIRPGLAQRMSAGRGITHSEMNASPHAPVHFLQMWVVPDRVGIDPGYEELDVSDRLASGDLVAVASGKGHVGAITLHQQGAVMWAARPDAGTVLALPDAPFVHVTIARGRFALGDEPLEEGDAVRLTEAGPRDLETLERGEIVVWETDGEIRR